MDRRKSLNRAAFTLVEVLVVILIIGILIGLLVPAVMAAIRKAREAQVSAEMNNLATALASFKNLNGDYPPSRVILCEQGYNYYIAHNGTNLTNPVGPLSNGLPIATGTTAITDTDITYSQLIARSQVYMSRFWPRADFNNGTILFDFNNDGNTNGVFILSGSECLAFFLGGIPVNNGNGTYAVTGFSKNPVWPFQNNVQQTNRSQPQYEFVVGRLIDQDGDGMPSYIDPLNSVAGSRRSYAYFSSYGSNQYDPNDVNGYGRISDQNTAHNDSGDFEIDDDAAGDFTTWGFQVAFPTTGGNNLAISPAPNPYTTGASANGNVAWVNPTTFQLISSGQDGLFGAGGTYSGGVGTVSLPPITTSTPGYVSPGAVTRIHENDNITNFSGGRLN